LAVRVTTVPDAYDDRLGLLDTEPPPTVETERTKPEGGGDGGIKGNPVLDTMLPVLEIFLVEAICALMLGGVSMRFDSVNSKIIDNVYCLWCFCVNWIHWLGCLA